MFSVKAQLLGRRSTPPHEVAKVKFSDQLLYSYDNLSKLCIKTMQQNLASRKERLEDITEQEEIIAAQEVIEAPEAKTKRTRVYVPNKQR